MPHVIEVDHITKEFQLGQLTSFGRTMHNGLRRMRGLPVETRVPFKALDDVSFNVQQGEVVGLIGHNGAGKSTLLKLLANISRPTRGAVRIRGRVAPLIEVGAGLVPDMTGRENIHLNASIMGMGRSEIRRKFDEIVAFSELEGFIDTPVKRYSSGMQIKLGFSIATAVASEILIVDEVLAVGDLAFQRKCFDRMETLIKREGRTVLLVSHNIRQVERISQRVILLNHGRVISDGDPKTVCEKFYDQSDRMIAANERVRDSDDLRSAGVIDLRAVRILNKSGDTCDSVATGSAVILELDLFANEPLRKLIFGVGVHTTDLLYLATEITGNRSTNYQVGVGPISLRVSIPSLPLLPGTYLLRIGIDAGEIRHNIFYAENIAHLTVVMPIDHPAKNSSEGFIRLNAHWDLGSVSDTEDHSDSSQVSAWSDSLKPSAAIET